MGTWSFFGLLQMFTYTSCRSRVALSVLDIERFLMPVDIAREGEKLLVHAGLLGFLPEEVEARVRGGWLTIRAER